MDTGQIESWIRHEKSSAITQKSAVLIYNHVPHYTES